MAANIFPTQWLTAQYKYVVDAIPILSMLKIQLFFSRSNCSQSVFDSMAAYAFSRMHFKGKNLILELFFSQWWFLSRLLWFLFTLKNINLKFLTLIWDWFYQEPLVHMEFYVNIIFENIPKSLDEAARIDGMKENRFIAESYYRLPNRHL